MALDKFDQLFGASSAHLFHWDTGASSRIASYRSSSFSDNHLEWDHYHGINPRRKILANLPVGIPMNCSDYIDDRAVSKSEYFADYSLPAGRRYLLGVNPYKERSITSAFAVMRAPHQAPFDTNDAKLLSHITPHLRHVARLDQHMRSIEGKKKFLCSLLDQLSQIVIVTNEFSRIKQANQSADRLFQSDGALRSRDGLLLANTDANTARLQRLIKEASRPATGKIIQRGGTIIIDTLDDGRWVVDVAPLAPNSSVMDVSQVPSVLILARRLGVSASLDATLHKEFGLTPSEARLARLIIAGQRIEEIADHLGVQKSTLRSQLKSVFMKTQTKRQGELMQLGILLQR
ncbi:MAG: helix-turn-helix transcriptional regulator [Pseudomonadota bacterium]